MTSKLPSYFEKYMDQKFGEIQTQILELKLHVNDEIQIIRVSIQRLQGDVRNLYVILITLAVLFIFHDFLQGSVFGWLIRFL